MSDELKQKAYQQEAERELRKRHGKRIADEVERGERKVRTRRASEHKLKAVHWLWAEQRVPIGVLIVWAGREDTGKTTVVLKLFSDTTVGKLPGKFLYKPQDVIVMTTEDVWGSTILPRLMANGANLERVHEVFVEVGDSESALEFPIDIDGLRQAIVETGSVSVLIDPLISRLDGRLDTYKDADVRKALEPLAKVAQETKCTIFGIVHFNKSAGADVLNAIMGSKGIVGTARGVFATIVEEDPETGEETRNLCHVKNNLGKKHRTMTFELRPKTVGFDDENFEVEACEVVWGAEREDTAAQIMERKARGQGPGDKAQAWLEQRLSKGPIPRTTLKKEAEAEGISPATLDRAAKALGIRREPMGREVLWSLIDSPRSQGTLEEPRGG